MMKWIALGIVATIVFLAVFLVGKPSITQESVKGEETTMQTTNSEAKQWPQAPEMTIDTNKNYTAVMQTSKGTMRFELFAKETPRTVNNFVFLSNEHFYDGTVFHRIIADFMIQGGDPLGTGMGGPGYKFDDEPVTREYTRGTLAMANSGPNTNGSQFFVVTADTDLPKNYTIFGTIAAGDSESLATLDAIAQTPVTSGPTGEPSKPTETVTVESVTIEEK